MPEALARSRNDSVLSRPARAAPRKDRQGLAQTIARRLFSRPTRTIAGAALAAILTGIVVNALVLQKERRSAPQLGAPRPATANVQPSAAPAPATAQGAPFAVLPPVRPAGLGAAIEAAPLPPPRSDDPIRDLLRGDAGKDAAHLTLAAQTALIKLGFAIKADGVVGASTEQAILQFERTHGLAPSSEVTAKLVRQLSAAANTSAH